GVRRVGSCERGAVRADGAAGEAGAGADRPAAGAPAAGAVTGSARPGHLDPAEDFAQARLLDAADGLIVRQPDALPPLALRPLPRRRGHLHDEDGDVADEAGLLVEVAADGFRQQDAGESGLLPRFLEGDLPGRLAGFEAALGDDPAAAAARRDEADPAFM